MSKSRKIALFIFFYLLLSSAATIAADDQTNATVDAVEEEWGDIWEAFDSGYGVKLRDWSYYNYSSKERHARSSIVRCGEKIYDPLSFKGGDNDTYAVAFYLSTEVAVSAAQARNGTLFEVAAVKGNEDYGNMMAQIQQDLKGNRSTYYTEINWNPGWCWQDWIGFSSYSNYFHRIYNYLQNGPPPPFSPDPTPAFSSILQSLQIATEEALGARLNYTKSGWDKGIHLFAPWEFNETFYRSVRDAMNSLAPSGETEWYIGPEVITWIEFHDHSNDLIDYGGENGTRMAFEQAIKGVEMMEYDSSYRYGDFVCGTYFVDLESRQAEERKANGTWVEPLKKEIVPWECRNWEECWRAWPWKWKLGD